MSRKKEKMKNKDLFRSICMLIFAIVTTGAFYFTWREFVKTNNLTGHLMEFTNIATVLIIYILLFVFIGKWMSAFNIGIDRRANLFSSQILTLFCVNSLEIFISCVIIGDFRFILKLFFIYAALFVVVSIINCLLIIIMLSLFKKTFPPADILEIFGNKNDLCDKFNMLPYKFNIKSSVYYEDIINDLEMEIEKHDAVLINDVPDQIENTILKKCFKIDTKVYFVPKISDVLVKTSREINIFDTPIFINQNNGPSTRQKIVKRLFDILSSGIALIILSPLLLTVSIAIVCGDGGPVFYKQERETLDGRHFTIFKFRSMIVDAEKDGKPHPAGEKDDRITKVGGIIRRCRIDELPQLINILKGDMSIVGPRPERIEHCDIYRKIVPEWDLRYKVRGGLTGYAQVYGMYNTPALDKIKLDLIYITSYSFVLDLRIIFQTIKVLTQKESTKAFDKDKIEEIQNSNLLYNNTITKK